METNRKRRGSKGKMAVAFYRAPKPSVQYTNKIVPTPTPPATTVVSIHVEDEAVVPSPKPKPSLIKKEGISNLGTYEVAANNVNTISEVDRRAANFIAYVQERFRLERMDDDWRNH
ncbi:hypothetical protein ZIOFF_065946 [Zingiber officinale]|uniref:Uncharacterized protein n=1 Tax=Zingiber officinale TaxID=94328 RepID=A0A8J5K931_ZINOF|nr:hypothetical protein ZIOFF_065946 [Zingiber officinale]